MSITVNGQSFCVPSDPRVSLLDFLRDQLALGGTKKGCDQGACGACTVFLSGERVLSCIALAVQCEGQSVTTIEGISKGESLHRMQQAFLEHDGFQCGYCTPGQIISAIGVAAEIERGVPSVVSSDLAQSIVTLTREEIAERMSGNLCRCGAYNGIVDAIADYLDADLHNQTAS